MTTKKTAAATVKKSPMRKTSVLAKPVVKPEAKDVQQPDEKKIKKEHKVKVVRDSFTMPQSEYQKIAEIKAICQKAKMHVKKSEVLRAGLKLLAELNAAQLKRTLNGLEKIKTGRPKKH
jgi:hypothetical protein